jgi:hypothetical protein
MNCQLLLASYYIALGLTSQKTRPLPSNGYRCVFVGTCLPSKGLIIKNLFPPLPSSGSIRHSMMCTTVIKRHVQGIKLEQKCFGLTASVKFYKAMAVHILTYYKLRITVEISRSTNGRKADSENETQSAHS